jgi:hypothetical protein
MKHIDSELSAQEMKFLQKLNAAEVPYWRKPVGWQMISVGTFFLLLHAIAVVAGLANHIIYSPLFLTGLLCFFTGGYELQEFRYQKIIRYMLLNEKKMSSVDGNKETQSPL